MQPITAGVEGGRVGIKGLAEGCASADPLGGGANACCCSCCAALPLTGVHCHGHAAEEQQAARGGREEGGGARELAKTHAACQVRAMAAFCMAVPAEQLHMRPYHHQNLLKRPT